MFNYQKNTYTHKECGIGIHTNINCLIKLIYYIFLIEPPAFSALLGGDLVQWLQLLAWKVGDRGFEPHSGLQVSKKQNVSPPAHS